jgi:regulator of sigma E protease
MAGMDENEDAREAEEQGRTIEDFDPSRGFNSKSVLQRMAVIFAGPLMNFVLAILLATSVFYLYGIAYPTTKIGELIKDAPAAVSGIQVGDTITSINGKPVTSWEDLVGEIQPKAGETVKLTVKRADRDLSFAVKVKAAEGGKGLIGIKPTETIVKQGLFTSLALGTKACVNATTMIAQYLGKMFTSQMSAESLGGPVRITVEIGKAAKTGLLNLANLTAILSINLGLFNLFPIPALDGSRLLFLLVEAVRGKPVNPARENMVHLVGLGLLLLLMVFVTFNDVSQLIKG